MGKCESCCRDRNEVKKHMRYNLEHRSDNYLRGKREKSIHKLNTNRLYYIGSGAAALGGGITICATLGLGALMVAPPTAVSIVECAASYDRAECAKIRLQIISEILKKREKENKLYLDTYSNIEVQQAVPMQIFVSPQEEYTEEDFLLDNSYI